MSDLAIQIEPPNGRRVRTVRYLREGAEIFRDAFDPDSSRDRADSITRLASALGQPAETLAHLGQQIREVADAATVGDLPEFRRLSSAELDRTEFALNYLVEGLLVEAQPCILAGPKKALKTTLAIDLAVSLASGGRFLGYYNIERAARVAVMSGESGMATIQETARRICRAAGQELSQLSGLVWSDSIPQIACAGHLAALREFLSADEIEVLIIDPTYLAMPGADAGNLFVQGAMLRELAALCQECGATLILCHHLRKGVADPFAPPELEDIAWAGFQEFARQWLLVGRREPYKPGTGEHRLWLNVGGSAGHSGLWGLDVAEGLRSDPGGRRWEVSVLSADEARSQAAEAAASAKEQKRETKAQATIRKNAEALKRAMARYPNGETARELRAEAGLGFAQYKAALSHLEELGAVEPCQVTKGRNQTHPGWKLVSEAHRQDLLQEQ